MAASTRSKKTGRNLPFSSKMADICLQIKCREQRDYPPWERKKTKEKILHFIDLFLKNSTLTLSQKTEIDKNRTSPLLKIRVKKENMRFHLRANNSDITHKNVERQG